MKIKVVTIKDIVKYLAKISIIFGVIIVFANFFYARKNVVNYFTFDSRKYLSTLKSEILMLNKDEDLNIMLAQKDYFSDTINGELSLLKMVSASDLSTTRLGKNSDEQNMNNSQDSQHQGEDNTVNENDAASENNGEIKEAETGLNVEILPSNIPDKSTYELFGVKLRNESDYNLQNEIKDLNVDFNKNDILIFHTHTCESYTPTEQYQYDSTGNYRTTDLNYTVARVGDELEKYLENYGYNVIHDKSYHDYPAYNGSYNRSLITVKNILENNPNTDIAIDLHRDAIGDNTYAPTVKIGDDYCARIMFVIGTDGGGLSHDNWRDNLKIAMKIVQKANELYPGLCKPIIVRNSRYNHHLSKGACIIEVGATGNTLEQCINSMKYLSKIYNEM